MGLEDFLTEHFSCMCVTALLVVGTCKLSKRGGRLRGFGIVLEEVAGANGWESFGGADSGVLLVAGISCSASPSPTVNGQSLRRI